MKNEFFNKVGNSIATNMNKAKFWTKKHSPELLIIGGIASGVACTVFACRATLKVSTIHEKTKSDLDTIDTELAKENPEVYSKDDAKKDAVIVYTRAAVQYTKEFAPAVIFGLMGIACVTYSNKIMRKRTFALAAAYATVNSSFEEYRKRVADQLGEDAELKLFRGIKAVTLEEPILNKKGEDTGKVKKTKIEVAEGKGSPYSKEYDHTCEGWNEGNVEYIDFFLRSQEFCANQMLQSRGYLFLNEVYKMLGMAPTIAGQSVGWIRDDNNEIGDNKVKFDRYIVKKPIERDGKMLYEKVHMIDFNVDGSILDRVSLNEI